MKKVTVLMTVLALAAAVCAQTGTCPAPLNTPSFNHGGGTYNNDVAVVITVQKGASVCYTVDGSIPAASTAGTCSHGKALSNGGTVSITTTGTQLQALATEVNWANSNVISATYTLQVATPAYSPDGGTNLNNDASVTISDTTTGTALVQCMDTAGSCTPGTPVSNPVAVGALGATTHLRTAGTESGFNASAVKDSTYTYQVAAPTSNPALPYTGPAGTLTLSDLTTGSAIHYNTVGPTAACTDPTYSSGIGVNSTTTYYAVACKSNYANSAQFSGTYTVGTASNGLLFTSLQDPYTTQSYCPSGNCVSTLNATAGGALLVAQCSSVGGTCAPTNGQGCATWQHISTLDVVDTATNTNMYTYWCPSDTAGATSVTFTRSGSYAVGAVWEASYTGSGTVTYDNGCTLKQDTAVSPLTACTIGSLTGSSDVMFATMTPAATVLLDTNTANGWTDHFSLREVGSMFAAKYNTVTTTPFSVNTETGGDRYDVVAVAFSGGSSILPVPAVAASGGALSGDGVIVGTDYNNSWYFNDTVSTDTLTWADSVAGSTINTCYGASATCTPSSSTNPQTVNASGYYCASATKSGMVASQVSCVNATIASVNVIPHNNCTAYNSAGTNNLCTFTPYTAGDTLIAACGNGDTVNSISGLKANSTSFSGPVAGIAGEDPTQIGFYPYIYYLANVPAVPTTISATTTAYDVTNCVVLDVTGMPPTAVTDGIAAVSESAYGNGALTNVTGSITTTHANDLILGFGIDNYVSFTPGTGYTMSTSTVVHAGAVEWQVVTSTGTFNPGIEWNGSGRIDAATVAFETN